MSEPRFDPARSDAFRDLLIRTASPRGRRGPGREGVDRRGVLITAVVAAVIALIAVVAIRAGAGLPHRAEPGGASREPVSSSELRGVVPAGIGTALHTWSSEQESLASGPFTAIGRSLVVTAACDGGGAISVTTPHRAARVFRCTHRYVQGPYWAGALTGDHGALVEDAPVRVRVAVTAGSPSFIVRLFAADPRILDSDVVKIAATSPAVPRHLRTCAAADLDPRAVLEWTPSRSQALVTITSRSATDCAVRSWPTMRYRTTTGGPLGPLEGADNNGRSVDSSEGSLNAYGEFPPARVPAGGRAYFLIDLLTEARLVEEDDQQRAEPAPTAPMQQPPLCRPLRVGSILFRVGGAELAAAAPTTPAPGACSTSGRAFGVNPVVAARPKAG